MEDKSRRNQKPRLHLDGDDQGIYCVCSTNGCSGRVPKPINMECDDLECPDCGGLMEEEES